MTPNRPYLVRALFDWIVDNNCTPYIILSAGLPGVDVPLEYVEDGKIVLNISPTAVVKSQASGQSMYSNTFTIFSTPRTP
jgi:stringent starvation protein B